MSEQTLSLGSGLDNAAMRSARTGVQFAQHLRQPRMLVVYAVSLASARISALSEDEAADAPGASDAHRTSSGCLDRRRERATTQILIGFPQGQRNRVPQYVSNSAILPFRNCTERKLIARRYGNCPANGPLVMKGSGFELATGNAGEGRAFRRRVNGARQRPSGTNQCQYVQGALGARCSVPSRVW